MAKEPKRPSRKGGQTPKPDEGAFFSPETLQTLHDARDSGHKYTYKFPGVDVVAEALRANDGNLLQTADALKVSRPTLYDWIEKNPALKTAREEGEEALLDFAQAKLKELIDGVYLEVAVNKKTGEPIIYKQQPSIKAIEFLLRTKGKKRGFVVDNKPARGDGSSTLWQQAHDLMKLARETYDTQGTEPAEPGAMAVSEGIDGASELGARPGEIG